MRVTANDILSKCLHPCHGLWRWRWCRLCWHHCYCCCLASPGTPSCDIFTSVEGGGRGEGSQGAGASWGPYMYLQARCGESGCGDRDNIVTGKILLRRSVEDTRGRVASQRGSASRTFINGALQQEVGRVDTITLYSPQGLSFLCFFFILVQV